MGVGPYSRRKGAASLATTMTNLLLGKEAAVLSKCTYRGKGRKSFVR